MVLQIMHLQRHLATVFLLQLKATWFLIPTFTCWPIVPGGPTIFSLVRVTEIMTFLYFFLKIWEVNHHLQEMTSMRFHPQLRRSQRNQRGSRRRGTPEMRRNCSPLHLLRMRMRMRMRMSSTTRRRRSGTRKRRR